MKYVLFLSALLPIFGIQAQVSAGADDVVKDVSVTWNVGEVITELMSNSQGSTASLLTIEELVTGDQQTTSADEYPYPNPAIANLTISINQTLHYRLLNIEGMELEKGIASTIDMGSYPSGMYILQINNQLSQKTISYKIVKQ